MWSYMGAANPMIIFTVCTIFSVIFPVPFLLWWIIPDRNRKFIDDCDESQAVWILNERKIWCLKLTFLLLWSLTRSLAKPYKFTKFASCEVYGNLIQNLTNSQNFVLVKYIEISYKIMKFTLFWHFRDILIINLRRAT